MTRRNHPAGYPARTKISYLVMLALLAGASGQAIAQTAPNLNTDPDFTYSRWVFEGEGGTITRITPPDTRYPSFNEACIPVSNRRTSLKTASWADNHFHLPNLASLEKNSLYRLSFTTRWDGPTTRMATSKLVATVSGGGRTNVYVDSLLSIDKSQKKFNIDFVTPVSTGDKAVQVHTLPTDIAFQAWASEGGTAGERMCINTVSLTLVGPNTEVMTPTEPVIRYNQAVTGPEDTYGNTYFTFVNPPVGSSVYTVDSSGRSRAIRVIMEGDAVKEPHSDLPAIAVPIPFGSATYKVQLRDGFNNVLKETPFLTGKPAVLGSGPYKRGVPTLRRDALHFFYAQRAGQAIVDGRYSEYRNPFSRPAGHYPERAKCFSGKDNFGNDFAGACKTASGKDPYAVIGREVSGGWYDAGDHGKYVVNGATALWALQNVIEHRMKLGTLNTDFPDNMLLYGSNDGKSDLLNEARYEMEWLLKMQINTPLIVRVPVGNFDSALGAKASTPGTVNVTVGDRNYQVFRGEINLTLTDVNAEGMVFSAVRDDSWTPLPTAPKDDAKPRVLDYPTTIATLNFAAVAAQSYRIWKNLDYDFAKKCLDAARVAWDAVVPGPRSNPNPKSRVFRYGEYSDHLNKPNGIALRAITAGGGAYADTESNDAYAWAAWELYIATSEVGGTDGPEARGYLTRLGELTAPSQGDLFTITAVPHAESLSWKHTKNLGVMSLLVNGRNTDIVQKVKDGAGFEIAPPMNGLKVWAFGVNEQDNEAALKKIAASAFGVPHTQAEPFNWASNADIANIGGILAFASKVGASGTTAAERAQFTAGARRTASYLFGNNPLGKSYVTGYGSNPVRNPHHRFWAKHADIAYPSAPPGMLVGGPNGKWEGSVLSATQDANGAWSWANDPNADLYMRTIAPTCNAHEKRGTIIAPVTVKEAVKKGGIGCYQDHVGLYMTNEVAINWNSALFWLSAYLD